MKHNLNITVTLVGIFFLSQIVGLLIVNQYIDHEQLMQSGELGFANLPFDVERPPIEQSTSVWYIMGAILIGTVLLLIIVKFKKKNLWRVWYFLSVLITLTIALGAFMDSMYAFIVSIIVSFFKAFRPHVWIHNTSELFIYGGLAAIFVPVMNVFSAMMLLLLISLYDIYAVWKSKHMVKLAEFTAESNVFAGLSIPYEKSSGKIVKKTSKGSSLKKSTSSVKNAILGGGDIGFPLLFAGVVMKELMKSFSVISSFCLTLVIVVGASIALLYLLMKGEKNAFYPAMPYLSVGCFVGWGVVLLVV